LKLYIYNVYSDNKDVPEFAPVYCEGYITALCHCNLLTTEEGEIIRELNGKLRKINRMEVN